MKLFATLLLSILVIFSACNKNDDDSSPYAGQWKGIYSGFDNGEWEAHVSEDGKFTGTVTPSFAPALPFSLTGTVTDGGEISAHYGYLGYTVEFEGQISGTSAAGTWSADSAGESGTWTGSKQ